MSNEITVVFHNVLNYDYHFIIEELTSEFEGQFECLGENAEICRRFSVPIEKEVTNISKDGNRSVVTISYKIRFIDSVRFTANSLSNHVDNLVEGMHKIECKGCDCFLVYESVKDNLIKYECLPCKSGLRTHLTLLIMLLINLFCY